MQEEKPTRRMTTPPFCSTCAWKWRHRNAGMNVAASRRSMLPCRVSQAQLDGHFDKMKMLILEALMLKCAPLKLQVQFCQDGADFEFIWLRLEYVWSSNTLFLGSGKFW